MRATKNKMASPIQIPGKKLLTTDVTDNTDDKTKKSTPFT
jgi:hypothetical protein